MDCLGFKISARISKPDKTKRPDRKSFYIVRPRPIFDRAT